MALRVQDIEKNYDIDEQNSPLEELVGDEGSKMCTSPSFFIEYKFIAIINLRA